MRGFAVIASVVFWGLLVTQLSGCGGGGLDTTSSASTSGDSGSVTGDVVGGDVSELSIASGSVDVDVSDVAEDEDVVFVLYSHADTTEVAGFEIGGSESVPPALTDVSEPDESGNFAGDLTGAFHDFLREAEEQIPADARRAASETGGVRFATTGSQKTFRVLNSFAASSSYQTVTATLRYQNDYFQFYVDDRDAESLSDEDLQGLAEDFAAVVPLERELFGTESDVNGDGKFAVLFTQVVNSLGGSSGGVVTGFFYAVDLFDREENALSNEMEIYYTFVPDPNGAYGTAVSRDFALSNILRGVLPHEYQHMISFNQHYFNNSGSAEVAWLNEGLSHLVEDVYFAGSGGYMERSGEENPARVSSYLSDVAETCFTCGSTLTQRGGAYLFLRYLYEQAEFGNLAGVGDGAEFIGKLLDTNLRGVGNLTDALGGDAEFKRAVGLFALTVYLSNTGASPNDNLYFDGINLRDIQDDNRGTVLNGPAIRSLSEFPFVDTLSGTSLVYLQVSGETLRDLGGSVRFEFDSDAKIGGYVVRE